MRERKQGLWQCRHDRDRRTDRGVVIEPAIEPLEDTRALKNRTMRMGSEVTLMAHLGARSGPEVHDEGLMTRLPMKSTPSRSNECVAGGDPILVCVFAVILNT
jgi:hypothetical protein